MLRRTYRAAYQMIRTADLELQYWFEEDHGQTVQDARDFWNFSNTGTPECSLAFWFGDANAGGGEDDFRERLGIVYLTIKHWSIRFRTGFYYPADIPVYIRCRNNWHIDPYAIHASLNVITLYGDWFDVPSGDWGRAIILLHEMGHLSLSGIKFLPVPGLFGATVSQIALLTEGPRDRRHEVCTRYENQCYGSPDPLELGAFQPPQIYDGQASGINPRRLVARFEAVGSGEARRDMLHNIDNYVCYMYNRWVDRNYCRVEV